MRDAVNDAVDNLSDERDQRQKWNNWKNKQIENKTYTYTSHGGINASPGRRTRGAVTYTQPKSQQPLPEGWENLNDQQMCYLIRSVRPAQCKKMCLDPNGKKKTCPKQKRLSLKNLFKGKVYKPPEEETVTTGVIGELASIVPGEKKQIAVTMHAEPAKEKMHAEPANRALHAVTLAPFKNGLNTTGEANNSNSKKKVEYKKSARTQQ